MFAMKLGIKNFSASSGRLEYHPNDIYNAGETFFKSISDKTFIFEVQECQGGKQSKELLTILQCISMSGTDKLLLVIVIEKSKQSRCFKSVNSVPVDKSY